MLFSKSDSAASPRALLHSAHMALFLSVAVVADLEDLQFECRWRSLTAGGDRKSLSMVQRGAELNAKLLHAFGAAALEQLVSVRGVTGLLVRSTCCL